MVQYRLVPTRSSTRFLNATYKLISYHNLVGGPTRSLILRLRLVPTQYSTRFPKPCTTLSPTIPIEACSNLISYHLVQACSNPISHHPIDACSNPISYHLVEACSNPISYHLIEASNLNPIASCTGLFWFVSDRPTSYLLPLSHRFELLCSNRLQLNRPTPTLVTIFISIRSSPFR